MTELPQALAALGHASASPDRVAYQAAWYQANKTRLAEKSRAYYEVNALHLKAGVRLRYRENADQIREQARDRYAQFSPEQKRLVAERAAKQDKLHPAKARARVVRRRTRQRHACPAWLTREQHDEIEAFYVEARERSAATSVPHEVDHEVPLRGKTVCGLHVPWNLQVLTAAENLKKGNRLP